MYHPAYRQTNEPTNAGKNKMPQVGWITDRSVESMRCVQSPHRAPSLCLPPYVVCHPWTDQSIYPTSRTTVYGNWWKYASPTAQRETERAWGYDRERRNIRVIWITLRLLCSVQGKVIICVAIHILATMWQYCKASSYILNEALSLLLQSCPLEVHCDEFIGTHVWTARVVSQFCLKTQMHK